MNNLAVLPAEETRIAVRSALKSSVYPGASEPTIEMILSYCVAAGLDPMLKPVHPVPMWDAKLKQMRDVVMPGIGLYRIQASRTGQYAGISEPEFGPDATESLSGQTITFPLWCKVSVQRRLADGTLATFTAKEFWKENYAVKGGADRSVAPNAMWTRRAYGQIAKCAEAQALRKAFPELGGALTAEEMEGKSLTDNADPPTPEAPYLSPQLLERAEEAAARGIDAYEAFFKEIAPAARVSLKEKHESLKAQARAVNPPATIDQETGEVLQGEAAQA